MFFLQQTRRFLIFTVLDLFTSPLQYQHCLFAELLAGCRWQR